MPLIPGTAHIVRWTKQNLLDTTTYFPYAIIRDTRTMTILDQFALTSISDSRYSKSWNVVQDGSGQGRQIEVEVTIYDDAAHTSVNAMYGRWTETYLVLQWQPTQTGGAGGAGTLDYRLIADMIAAAVKRAFDGFEKVQVDAPDFSGVEEGLEQIHGTVRSHLEANGQKLSDSAALQAKAAAVIDSIRGDVAGAIAETAKQSLEGIMADISSALTQHHEAIASAIRDGHASLASASDEERQASVKHYVDVMQKNAEKISGDLSTKLEETLSRLKMKKTTEQYDMVQPKPEIKKDTRGQSFLSYANKR